MFVCACVSVYVYVKRSAAHQIFAAGHQQIAPHAIADRPHLNSTDCDGDSTRGDRALRTLALATKTPHTGTHTHTRNAQSAGQTEQRNQSQRPAETNRETNQLTYMHGHTHTHKHTPPALRDSTATGETGFVYDNDERAEHKPLAYGGHVFVQ